MNKKPRRFAAAGTAAAALGIGAAAWASSPASAAPALIGRCAPGQLAVWVNADNIGAAAGSSYYHLDFTNTGTATCHLHGYPGVSAVNGAGAQLGDAASRDPVAAPRYVNIAPGGTAHTILQVASTDNYPAARCEAVSAARLKVYPPGDTGARHAFYDLPSCSVKGAPYLSVEVVQPGT